MLLPRCHYRVNAKITSSRSRYASGDYSHGKNLRKAVGIVFLLVALAIVTCCHSDDAPRFSFVYSWTSSTANIRKNLYNYKIPLQFPYLQQQQQQQPLQHPLIDARRCRTNRRQQIAMILTMMTPVDEDNSSNEETVDDDDNDTSIKTMLMNNDSSDNDTLEPPATLPNIERVWRYNKKPLLSIGAQRGPTLKHGNSLRELLQHHTTVKVKIQLLLNSSSSISEEDQMLRIYNQLKDYVILSDESMTDIELLQLRVKERILLIGLPGTTLQIMDGTYPPPPPPPRPKPIRDPTDASQ